MKVLVTGWFSFDCGHATAGDVLARDVVCRWLEEAGCSYDVAAVPPFQGDLDWMSAVPTEYDAVLFICGPFRPGWPLTEYLEHFAGTRLVGVNVSMLEQLGRWNPFDLLLERDSDRVRRPDLAFVSEAAPAPVVGRILVHPQSEYRERQRHTDVDAAVHALLEARDLAVVPIDTRLDENPGGLRTGAQVEGLIAKKDTVVTTRLHGLVLALKNGVPALAIDPIAGGAKVAPQADAIGWPVVFEADELEKQALEDALDFCLSEEGRALARECARRARDLVRDIRKPLIDGLGGGRTTKRWSGSSAPAS
jgi:hypothetical protein